MARKEKCRRCGRWFTMILTVEGMYWCPPPSYDPTLCADCNAQIEADENQGSKYYRYKMAFKNH